MSGNTLVEPYVVSNSKLSWEIKQWLLTVSDYADDLEFDEATNTVKGNSSIREFGIPLAKKKKQQGGGGGNNKKKSSKDKEGGEAPRSPAPPSSSKPSSSRSTTAPSSAPAAGATQKKGAFKLRSPKFLRNLLHLPNPQQGGVDLDMDDSEASTSHRDGLEETAKPPVSTRSTADTDKPHAAAARNSPGRARHLRRDGKPRRMERQPGDDQTAV